MKTLLKNDLSKFFMMVLLGSFLCSALAFILTKVMSINSRDIMFVVGLLLTIGAIFSMIEGRPTGAQSIIKPESQYINSDSIDVTKLDKEKLLTSVYIIDKVRSTLLSTEFLVIGLIALMISYII